MKQIIPLHDYILVARIEPRETTDAGIFIPDNTREKRSEGIVRAVGPGAFQGSLSARVEPSVAAGDRVVFGKYAGTEIDSNGETLLLVRDGDIFAKVTEPA